MKIRQAIGCGLGAAFLALTAPAFASQQTYSYKVVHPRYGEIGTLTESVDQSSGTTRIDSHLRVLVRFLGIVAYREENDATEVLHDNRLVSLQCSATKNGARNVVTGEAEGDHFVVNSPLGTVDAPADVEPSDPLLVTREGDGIMVSTKSGKVENAHITGGENTVVSIQGVPVAVRHFTIITDKRQEVWLDRRGVPVRFQTMADGTPIDFELRTPLPPDELAQVTPSFGADSVEDSGK